VGHGSAARRLLSAGDGEDESFTAQMIVSDGDLADNISGIQNLWVQRVGCGTAIVNFD
jgi:hypothetical protein